MVGKSVGGIVINFDGGIDGDALGSEDFVLVGISVRGDDGFNDLVMVGIYSGASVEGSGFIQSLHLHCLTHSFLVFGIW